MQIIEKRVANRLTGALLIALVACTAGEAEAQTSPSPPPYRPYSIPFMLRPLPAVNLVRLDSVFVPHDAYGPATGGLDLDVVQLATVGIRATPWLMFLARMGWDWTSRPGTVGMSNLTLGANITMPVADVFRLSFFVGAALPLGTDAGGSPNHRGARLARMGMDNAMFQVDHLNGIAGLGLGFIDGGWTVQAEATLLVLARVEGMSDAAVANSTFGLHVGYFIVPEFSLGGELRHQQFVSNPAAYRTDPYGEELRAQTSGSLGARLHFQVGAVWIRPAVSWSIGFDPPLAGDSWQSLQLDLPFIF